MENRNTNQYKRNPRYIINDCYRMFNEYSWLTNAYVLDFYTQDLWGKLLSSWRVFLDETSPSIIGKLLDYEKPFSTTHTVLPLSLMCLRLLLKQLCISRIHNNTDNKFYNDLNGENAFNLNKKVANAFWKNVKLKKRHEILQITKMCLETATKCDCKLILDIGSGLGHLSRVLSYAYGFNVLSIEADRKLSETARILDTKFRTVALKYLPDNKFGKVIYLNRKIETDTTVEEIQAYINKFFSLSNNVGYGIIGLHPCGDLATVLLQFYRDSKNVRFISIANCCYMKLSMLNSSLDNSFPVSEFCKNNGYTLSYNCREVACHALEMYIAKLQSDDHWELKIHAYRAAIEKLIVDSWPHLNHLQLNNVKYRQTLSFGEYCKVAVKKLRIVLNSNAVESEEVLKNLEQWCRVVKFYSVRLMLAPLIETVILLDRLLYLEESGGTCKVLAAFNPRISPRNHILMAVKQ